MTRTRIFAALVALAAALLLTSCSSTPPDTATGGHANHDMTDQTPVITGEPAAFNADDVSFATNMIPHHQQAVELAALVPDRSTNPEVLSLAGQISAAQEPEIATLKAFLVQWRQGSGSIENPHGGHGDMAGMVDAATMTRLESLRGAEFDRLWLQSMIDHHRGAIEMAKAELAKGQNADAKALAQAIITAQQSENEQMDKMLAANP